MVKHYVLIPKRPDVSEEYFHTHWRDNHSQLAMMIRTLDRYTQSHRLGPAVPGFAASPFDGIAECGFADLERAFGLSTNPDYTENAKEDDPTFIAIEDLGFFTCEEPALLRTGPAIEKETPGVKAMLLLTKAAGSEPAAFQKDLEERGPSLLEAAPEAHTVMLCNPVLATYAGDPPPAYDAIVELYYPNRASYEAEWSDAGPRVAGLLAPIIDAAATGASPYDETRFIWPAGDDG